MSATSWELLDFIARWLHVIAGIMWVGNSLLFNWLDRSLRPPNTAERGKEAIGTIWLLHSGGFYYVEKTLLRDERMPVPLHWFKWQAYTTWLSGMLLLLVVYYLGDRAVLADPAVRSLSHSAAVLVGFGSIAAGWILYETMQRWVAPRAPLVAAIVWIGGFTAIAVGLTQLLSGRAAFLHVGAMLGTIMAGNVFFTIVPSQRELVASVTGTGSGSGAASARAKRVSIHNNYFTFPVLALMVSNHFPAIYGNRWNWLLLIVIIIGGALIRHILNTRFTTPSWQPRLAVAMIATAVAIYGIMMIPRAAPSTRVEAPATVTFADARHIIDRRCSVCHSAQPVDLTFGPSPAGVSFDTPEQILARVARINERAVVTKTMPPGNKTNVTELERAMLARWIAAGAPR
jgi:uncharacterized membrane protein